MKASPLKVAILAGGSGTRLWPLSRRLAPKQFLRLAGDETLLGATVKRVEGLVARDQVVIVTAEDLAKGEGYRQLQPYEQIFEPVGRNTAPAIGVAALHALRDGGDPVMLVLPSDHLIRDVAAFQRAVQTALAPAMRGELVTFGVKPTHAATGYGYILAAESSGAVRRVASFVEKPDAATAEAFLREGTYLWNAGIFVWKATAILSEIERALPPLHAVLERIRAGVAAGATFQEAVREHFAQAPSISIDHGVLQGNPRVHVVPAEFDWSDVGSWDAVHDITPRDANGNALQGNVVALDCENTYVRSEDRLVAAIGLRDVSIVETPDAILVTRHGQSQRVREVVDELQRRNAEESVIHLTVQRPWGSYTVLQSGAGVKIKRIEVDPGARLSLQSHLYRSEHWVVIEGCATVTIDGRETRLVRNESTYVPTGSRHRLENREATPLRIIEVQVGDRVDEEDITRYDDSYGR